MTVAALVSSIRTCVQGIPGLKRVHSDPVEAMNEFPCAIVYAARGELGKRAGRGIAANNDHVIAVEIHHARQVLPQAVATSQAWPDQLLAQLTAQAATLNIQYPVTYQAGVLRYADEVHYGIRFEITVRE